MRAISGRTPLRVGYPCRGIRSGWSGEVGGGLDHAAGITLGHAPLVLSSSEAAAE